MISGRVVQAEPSFLDQAEDLSRGHGLAHAGDEELSVRRQGIPLGVDPVAPDQLPESATMTAAVTPPNVPCSTAPSSTAWSEAATDSGRGPLGNAGKSPSVKVGEGWGLGAVVPVATSEVGSAGVGPSGEVLHPAIRIAIAAVMVRSADERMPYLLVMGTGRARNYP
jgi:hypothetical protein